MTRSGTQRIGFLALLLLLLLAGGLVWSLVRETGAREGGSHVRTPPAAGEAASPGTGARPPGAGGGDREDLFAAWDEGYGPGDAAARDSRRRLVRRAARNRNRLIMVAGPENGLAPPPPPPGPRERRR